VAWRFKTDNLGPRPETKLEGTPIKIGNTVYATAGTRRAVVALNATSGEMRWMYAMDEGERARPEAEKPTPEQLDVLSSAANGDKRTAENKASAETQAEKSVPKTDPVPARKPVDDRKKADATEGKADAKRDPLAVGNGCWPTHPKLAQVGHPSWPTGQLA